ncbi:MAG: aminopeptidase P family protein, partial [Saprospiraceae bacterium]|nr:aminopeptidase P family protein [Saprospiraceae bacterium]
PSGDPHQSEYPAAPWKGREWISGFTGSAGTAVITLNHAGVWTDSRYFLQAESELADSEFELHKMYNQFSPGYISWLSENLPEGSKVAIDGPLFSLNEKRKFESMLSKRNISLIITDDVIDEVWEDRPAVPLEAVFEHDVRFAGKSRAEKLAEVRAVMSKHHATHHLISTLDDIGWLLNLRGYDVEFNPVFVAYCVVSLDSVELFVDASKLTEELAGKLRQDNIRIHPYSNIYSFLNTYTSECKMLVDNSSISIKLYESLKQAQRISGPAICRDLKAIKNEIEIEHFRKVMIKDGVALTHAFKWLEDTLDERTVTEYEFFSKLAECRSKQAYYYGESFAAIIGYKGNGAIIHYRPQPDSSAEIKKEGILLADSGGQYYDGTTDITRTITFTPPSAEEKNAYTRVLKGHIGLSRAQFPEGTNGAQLDTYARQHLWEDGLNYLHGTGHGVGFFMNVHEPPQGFAPGSSQRATTVHKVGMVSSNEPGYYKEGHYGIRIENLIVVEEASKEGFLQFETITMFPIDTQLIDRSLMTADEINWLNNYHKEVFDKLSPQLDEEHKNWLARKCESI